MEVNLKGQNIKKICVSAFDLRNALKGYRIKLDCGHHFCFHNLSNSMYVNCDGEMICHECYGSLNTFIPMEEVNKDKFNYNCNYQLVKTTNPDSCHYQGLSSW